MTELIKLLKRLRKSEDGYVFVLILLFMPVFLGVALLVIDIGRANNSHSDLQAAADAVAIAGAIELNGEPGAIANAKAAMAQATNTVSMLKASGSDLHIDLTYADASGNEFAVVFLDDIPTSDDTPIDTAWMVDHATTDDAEADYVYVAVQSTDFTSVFPKPSSLRQENVSLGARAVGTNPGPVACDVAPVFICNPFQLVGGSEAANYARLEAAMDAGRMHGRLISLFASPSTGTEPAGPGNWGYLRVGDGTGGANVLRDALGGYNPECYETSTVDTKPGKTQSVAKGFNTRFDSYEAPMHNVDKSVFSADVNVREFLDADGARIDNDVMIPPGGTDGTSGAYLAEDWNWNLRGECRNPTNGELIFKGTRTSEGPLSVNEDGSCGSGSPPAGEWEPGYWEVAHGTPWDDHLNTAGLSNKVIRKNYSNEVGVLNDDTLPSRYDIYQYELDATVSDYYGPLAPSSTNSVAEEKRREMFVVIVNCDGLDIKGDTDDVPVLAFATVFLPNQMADSDRLAFELIDLTGYAGSTSLDEIIIEESILVR